MADTPCRSPVPDDEKIGVILETLPPEILVTLLEDPTRALWDLCEVLEEDLARAPDPWLQSIYIELSGHLARQDQVLPAWEGE